MKRILPLLTALAAFGAGVGGAGAAAGTRSCGSADKGAEQNITATRTDCKTARRVAHASAFGTKQLPGWKCRSTADANGIHAMCTHRDGKKVTYTSQMG